MSELVVAGLSAGVEGTEIIHDIDLTVRSGEVHVIMGPNGSGKSTLSHVLMGRPGYEVISGTVHLDGVDLLALPAWQRAQAGLFLALQYPTEVPGVLVEDALAAAFRAAGRDTTGLREAIAAEAGRIGFEPQFLERAVNVDLSGGEKKRNETLQLAVLAPRIAVLDELDSGLDIDALRACARRIEALTNREGHGEPLGVLAITHYNRLLQELRADHIHVLVGGRIVESGGFELAEELERGGYARFGSEDGARSASVEPRSLRRSARLSWNGAAVPPDALNPDDIRARLAGRPGWELAGDKIRRQYKFADFASAFGFMAAAAVVAERMNHHPELVQRLQPRHRRAHRPTTPAGSAPPTSSWPVAWTSSPVEPSDPTVPLPRLHRLAPPPPSQGHPRRPRPGHRP